MAYLKLKRICSSGKMKMIESNIGGHVLGYSSLDTYKIYDHVKEIYWGGIFKSEDFTIENAIANPTINSDYSTSIDIHGPIGKFENIVQSQGFVLGFKSETASGISYYDDYYDEYRLIPNNVCIYNGPITIFDSLETPRAILSGLSYSWITEIPINKVYANFDTAIIYGDSFNLHNEYDQLWNIDSILTSEYTSVYLRNTRYYNKLGIYGSDSHTDLWMSYKFGYNYKGQVDSPIILESQTPVQISIDTSVDTNIKDYEFIERIKGVNRMGANKLHKSNIFSIRIRDSGLNESITDTTVRERVQNSINTIIKDVITRVAPIYTQLWKIIYKGQ